MELDLIEEGGGFGSNVIIVGMMINVDVNVKN